jgi:hypothetical protein
MGFYILPKADDKEASTYQENVEYISNGPLERQGPKYIYKYTLMGLWRGKVQSIFIGFYILPRADDKEASTYQEKRYVQKKRGNKKNGKVSIKKHSVPHLGLGGLRHKKRREESLSANHIEKYLKRQYMEQVYLYF